MARQSKRNRMKALSALLFLAIVCLVTVGIAKLRRDDILSGTQLIGWALIPLTILLGFTFPARCKVKTGRRKACKNDSYGFLFGCNRYGHWKEKFLVRLGLRGETKPIERRKQATASQQATASVALAQPTPQSKPIRVTVEDNGFGVCGFWVGVVSAVASVIQVVTIFVH